MLTQAKSGRALMDAKAKSKNVEFGRNKDEWPSFLNDSDRLSFDAILTLSVICEEICEQDQNNPHAEELKIIAQYFDAAKKTGDREKHNWDFLLSGAVAYFINNDFGSSKALLSQVDLSTIISNTATQLFCFLCFILKNMNNFSQHQVDNDLLMKIRRHYQFGEEHPSLAEMVEWRKVINGMDSVYDNYYIDLLIAVVKVAEQNSAWKLMPQFAENSKEKWDSYLRRSDTPKILWSAQKLIGEKGVYNGKDCIIQLPTGTGKTKSIELIIKSAFIEERANSILVLAPLRALCFEISRDLQQHFRQEAKISRLSDSLIEDEVIRAFGINTNEKSIIVCTPEKLNYVMRHKPEILEAIDIFVFDEGHMFDDESRGVEYELLLTTIKNKAKDRAQKIFISAVLPNTGQINEWLFQNNAEVVSSTVIKTTEKSKGFLSADIQHQIRFFSDEIDVNNPDSYLPRIIKQETLNRIGGRGATTVSFPDLSKPGEVALYFALELCGNGNIAIFVKRRSNIKTIIERLLDLNNRGYNIEKLIQKADPNELERMANLIGKHYGEEHYLKKGIIHGLAGHHSKLENGVKISIEYALQESMISAVVCTSTLAQGVNLPLRYLLITDVTIGNEGKKMKVREFQNLIGRTARSGMHTEGSVIITNSKLIDKRLERGRGYYDWIETIKLFDTSHIENCESTIKRLFDNFRLDWDGHEFAGLDIARAILANFEGELEDCVYAQFNGGLLPDDKKREFRLNIKHRIQICDSIESYICFIISKDEEGQEFSEEQYKSLSNGVMQQTFAYMLCSEEERVFLISLAEKIATRLFQNKTTVVKKFIAQSLVGFSKGNKLCEFLVAHSDKINSNVTEFLLECIKLVDEIMEEELSNENITMLINFWLNGATVIEISRALNITIEDAEKLCGYCSYQLSYLLGELADMENFNEGSEYSDKLRELQQQMKYGLTHGKEMRVYEDFFHDRYIAKMVAGIIGDNDIVDELILHRVELAQFLMNFPLVFFDKFTEVVGIEGME